MQTLFFRQKPYILPQKDMDKYAKSENQTVK